MAANQRQPLVIIHRLPGYELVLSPLFRTKYTVIDQHDEPPDPSFTPLSKSARLIICWGPTPLTSDDLDKYPAVECVIATTTGINHFDLAACRRRCIRVTNVGDNSSDDVAEYAFGLAVDVLRRVSAADRFVRAGSWTGNIEYNLGSKVSGKRVGIVGLGNIGSRVAKMFEAFGCPIAYNSRQTKTDVSFTYYANVVDLASNSDILIVCCPLTNETYHVINKDVLIALGKAGIVVNVGRGPLIDEKELVGMLVRGEVGGAGLDVFENEPQLPEELFTLDNVVLSPHFAGLTKEAFAGIENLILINSQAFFSNEPLRGEIENY